MRFTIVCFGRCQSGWPRKAEGSEDMSIDTKESLRIFLTQQLREVEEDIETISSYIYCHSPETTGELLKLRELQRKYREIATSLKNEIVSWGNVNNQSSV
jgi:hypothetical protein